MCTPAHTRFALALLALQPACFSEPEPIDDDGGDTVVMCVQAPCTATDASPTTSGPEPTTTTDASTGAVDSGDSTAAAGSSSDDEGSTETAPSCGNGVIDQPSEMCDSTPGCLDDCTFESYDCNPLGDAGCMDGLRCGAVDVPSETFSCMLPGKGGVGSPCSGVPNNDGDCDAGLTCLFNFSTPLCDAGNCCVEYCDVTDDASRCSGGAVCRPFFAGPMFQGLEHLGFCGDR